MLYTKRHLKLIASLPLGYLPEMFIHLKLCLPDAKMIKYIFSSKRTEKLRPVSNLEKGSSQSAANSYKKITIYLIHYNQPTGNILLQNQPYLQYIMIILLVWKRVKLQL